MRSSSLRVLTAAVAAAPFVLLAAILGMAVLRDEFEGVRPLVAALAVLLLVSAAAMVRGDDLSVKPSRGMLWIVAGAATLVAAYLFFAAAPGGPASNDSWGELILAALGLWFGLVAFRLLGKPVMWAFVGATGLLLVAASIAV